MRDLLDFAAKNPGPYHLTEAQRKFLSQNGRFSILQGRGMAWRSPVSAPREPEQSQSPTPQRKDQG